MDVTTSAWSETTRRISEPSTLQGTLGSLDKAEDHSSSIFSGFAALLAILLVVAVICVLWCCSKRKKRQVPYLRVTIMPLLTLPRPRQRAKNIYDLLPRRQEELGRHPSRSIRIVSTESLLSRNSDSPSSEHVPSRAGDALHMHRAHTHAMGYAVGIYDNAMRPQMCGNLAPSPHYVNVRASRGSPSTSSEDSRDYVNIPTAKEIAETLASASNPPRNLFILPGTKELAPSEEIDEGCGNASDCTSLGSPGTENSDPLSDGEGSSQTSNDYVNMAELDLGTPQGKQLQGMFQCRRDYENVPPGPSSNKQQEEEVTSSNTDHVEGRTDGPETHTPPAVQSGSFLALKDHVACQSSAHSETGPWEDAEETSSEDSHDYENVCAAEAGARG
ncbi:lymphocyte transmembrane adapter 1 [Bos indicus x Bos taurus]|uniref:lymphocyte transmembrane adapter 1 n=1 Tax=Bos indicus x Bos taurus TaxID=30522 RepID=UPI000F7D3895|nr:lymphocyte transmembrane adapter 1 [Bos indicus x Bos taurus]XP_027419986.1 lymphocyte transmembrane adapter 1 [Bos indicus x Bos taurus]